MTAVRAGIVAAVVAVVALVAWAILGSIPPGPLPPLRPGDPFDWSAVTSADGRAFVPAPRDGRPVELDLWATWCTPCEPRLRAFADAAKSDPSTTRIALNFDNATPDRTQRVGAWLTARGIDVRNGFASTSLLVRLGVSTLPATVRLRADGTIEAIGP